MVPLQTRIFVPPAPPYTNERWVETVAGRILNPVVQKHGINYFWFTRYGGDKVDANVDADVTDIPEVFAPKGIFLSVRFRFWLDGQDRSAVEADIKAEVAAASCWLSDVRPYDDMADLAWERFCGEPFTGPRRQERRDLMRQFLCSSAKLFLHMLQGPLPSGEYFSEQNSCHHNPEGSTFESIHHLFCTMTEVPLRAVVQIGTRMYPPQAGRGALLPIRF